MQRNHLKELTMKILLTVLSTIAGLLILGFIVIYSGMINVSVLDPPSGFTKWILSTTKERSVDVRAEDLPAPDLDNENMIKEGAEHYVKMCQGCHGAPGIEDTELAKGLEPIPPHLYKSRADEKFNAGEVFWVTKNGIMMTAMPAWGTTHSDKKIWEIVAFLKKLPNMNSAEYNSFVHEFRSESQEVMENDQHKE
jgi:mono/diheme cytochrome c family protein